MNHAATEQALDHYRPGHVYRRRLKKEAAARRIIDVASAVTPRLRKTAPANPARIGVFCQWGVGDAVLLLPLLRGLRQQFPVASIELIGKPWLADLFADEDCCDRTHVLVPPWTAYANKYRRSLSVFRTFGAQIARLRQVSFDWLISARFDPREIMQLRLLCARATFGYRSAGGRFWITNDLAMTRSEHDRLHRATLANALVRRIAEGGGEHPARFLINGEKQAEARRWLDQNGYREGSILAVHTGAGHPIRRWRDATFDPVLRRMHTKPGMVVFIHDPGNSVAPWNGPIPHAQWQGSLSQLKALLSLCDVFLGADSGVMHMAAAAGCKVVGLFGPGEPIWFAPAGAGHRLVLVPEMPCRPCFDKCIFTSARCLDAITDREIAETVEAALTLTRSDNNQPISSGLGNAQSAPI